MANAVVSLTVICLCLGLSVVNGHDPHGRPCSQGPPVGRYSAEHFIPQSADNNTLSLQATSIFTLDLEFENVFSGAAAGAFMNNSNFPDGTEFSFRFLAIWKPEVCLMSGSIFNLDPATPYSLPFQWEWNTEQLIGEYLNAFNGTVLYRAASRHELTYLGL